MNQTQRVRQRKLSGALARQPVPDALTSTRQSPTTDIRALTRLVFESYQTSYGRSSPKVQRRYKKLTHDLAESGKV